MGHPVIYQGTGGARQQAGTAAAQQHALFGQTMGYVAATAALFALGSYLGRDLAGGIGIIAFVRSRRPPDQCKPIPASKEGEPGAVEPPATRPASRATVIHRS
jgi:hypothetical protein